MTMQVPLEIAFHNTESSEWAENEIRARVAELEEIYGRLTSCRVRVDQRAENRNGTIPPVVRIELRIPGHKDIVVAHEPEHLQRKFQRPDLHNAIQRRFASPSGGCATSRSSAKAAPRSRCTIPKISRSARWWSSPRTPTTVSFSPERAACSTSIAMRC
jgi:hypothetical protein